MPKRRKSHVYRAYQTDDDGNVVDENVWVDVLRIDLFATILDGNTGVDGQVVNYYTDWRDDTPTVPERKYSALRLISPDDPNPDNPTTVIVLPIISKTQFVFPSTTVSTANQVVAFSFNNKPGDTKRMVHKIRVYNNDLNNEITMPDATVGQPQPVTKTHGQGLGNIVYPITWDDYAQALQNGAIDDTAHIDVEVVDGFNMDFPTADPSISGQLVAYLMKNRQTDQGDPIGVRDLFSAPPADSTDTVYRTDPLQIIVNVSWGGLAVEFGDHDQDAP